jgi:hypothetical protein
MSAGFSVVLFALLVAFFACVLLGLLSRDRRLLGLAAVSLVATVASVMLWH